MPYVLRAQGKKGESLSPKVFSVPYVSVLECVFRFQSLSFRIYFPFAMSLFHNAFSVLYVSLLEERLYSARIEGSFARTQGSFGECMSLFHNAFSDLYVSLLECEIRIETCMLFHNVFFVSYISLVHMCLGSYASLYYRYEEYRAILLEHRALLDNACLSFRMYSSFPVSLLYIGTVHVCMCVCLSLLASYASRILLEYRALLPEHRALLENACLSFRKCPMSLFHKVFFACDTLKNSCDTLKTLRKDFVRDMEKKNSSKYRKRRITKTL